MLEVAFLSDSLGTHRVLASTFGDGMPPSDLAFKSASTAVLGTMDNALSVWSLHALSDTPFLDRVTPERLIDLYVYRPIDREAIIAFDRRISARYAELCAVNGEFYAGPFGCDALGPDWIVEAATYASDNIDDVDQILDESIVPPELEAIADECRTLQNRETFRYLVRLVPLMRRT